MAANGFTVVTRDPLPARQTSASRHEYDEPNGGANVAAKVLDDERGFVCEIGRGTLDKNVTYFALKNTSGVTVYIWPNAAGNGIEASQVKP